MGSVRYFLLVVLSVGVSSSLYALGSGAFENQTGVSVKALSHVAYAGVADDPSAIYYNPAGLVQVPRWQLQTGSSFLKMDSEHTDPSGKTDKSDAGWVAAPHLYFSYGQPEGKWALGVGLNTPFGLISRWNNDSFSRNYTTEARMAASVLNPTVAYAVTDRLSFGAGLDYVDISDVGLKQKVPFTDGDAEFNADGHAWGYNFGALWKASARHSFGLSYRSQVNVPVSGEVELKNVTEPVASMFLGGASSYKTGAQTEFKFPQSVALGYGFHANDRWTMFADYEWVNWNTTQETKFTYDQNNAILPQSIERRWRNTNNLGVGAEFKARDWWDVRFGSFVYERVVPSSTLESQIPDAGRVGLTLGSGFHFGKTSVDVGYTAILLRSRSVDNNAGNAYSSMDGTFKSMMHVFGIGLSQKWG
jgi:long-chain fatty acid transport protein